MWTHRVAHVTTEICDYYDIREYFPDVEGEELWTEDAIDPYGETIDDLIEVLEWMLKAAKKAKDDPSLMLELDGDGGRRKEARDD